MTRSAIAVENLSKAYRIGLRDEIPDSLVGAIQGVIRSPWKNLQRLRRLNTFHQNGDAEDTIWALNDVSFDVPEGDVVGIIGRNGAGKSTLLKILSRITEPTCGRAVIRGRVSSLLEVGTGFHPELTGRENIYLNGTILGMTKREIDRKFDEIVGFSGVEKFLDTPIKRYSSGMQVRLAFSVAAHLEPEILIIDEVLAVGDMEFQRKCLGKMEDVARSGRTVLFVSHNMPAIESLCSQAILLVAGRLESKGTVPAIVERYQAEICSTISTGDDAAKLRNCRYLRSIALLDADGQPTSMLRLGSTLHAAIKLLWPNNCSAVTLGIGIDGSMGMRVLTVLSPGMSDRRSPDGCCEVHCRINQLPIPPGHYSLKVALNGFDEANNVCAFTVVDADAFGERRGFHRGSCVAPSEWWVQVVETGDAITDGCGSK